MRKILSLSLLSLALTAQADFQPEATGIIKTLPNEYPDHWVMIHDASFFHMFEGEVLVVDPLGADIGAQYKGMMTASFIASYVWNEARNEHYVIETFNARGSRGGERTDLVAIYDTENLSLVQEIIIPPKRISGMPKKAAVSLLGGGKFLGVYNFTPGQSVSIVNLESREFVAEIPTAGCGFVIPNGERSFTSICSNGSFLTTHLNEDGTAAGTTKTDVSFDVDNDPIFETLGIVDGVAYFPTFAGNVLPVDVSGEEISVGEQWSLLGDGDEGWRPGGMNIIQVDSSGLAHVLVHPEGGEGTHKNGGGEVWSYDMKAKQRVGRLELKNWGISLGTTGTGEGRLLLVTNADMGIDVYRLENGEFVHTIGAGQTPFLSHGVR